MNTCEHCEHWDKTARLKTAEWRKTADPEQDPWQDAHCDEILCDGIEVTIRGDGYIEDFETDATFGCNHFTPATPEEKP